MQLVRTTRTRVFLLLGTCAFGLTVGNANSLRGQKPQTPPRGPSPAGGAEVDKAIRETAQRFADAFNKGDAKAIAALWTEDGDFVDEAGERTVGREAIGKKYAAFFAENSDGKIEVIDDSVRQVTSPGCGY